MTNWIKKKASNNWSFFFSICASFSEFLAAFLLGYGIDAAQAKSWVPLVVGLAIFPIFLIVWPLLSHYSKGFSIGHFHLDSRSLFVTSQLAGMILAYIPLRIETAFNSQGLINRTSLAPLITCFLAFILNALLFFMAYPPKKTEAHAVTNDNEPNNLLIRLAPLFFITYFLLSAAPYLFAKVSVINTFLTSPIPRIIYRGAVLLYLLAYSVGIAITTKTHLRLNWIPPLVLVAIAFLLAWFCEPNAFSYYAVGKMGSVTQSTTVVSTFSYAVSFFLYCAEAGVFLICLSWLSKAVTCRKTIIWFFSMMVALVFLSCAISVAIESSLYRGLFSGSGAKLITGIFHHKNEFGAFLFLGGISAAFLFRYVKVWQRYLFLTAFILFLSFSVAIRCYTGLYPLAFLAICLTIYDLAFLWKKSKVACLSLSLLTASGLIALILCVAIEPIRSKIPFFASIYTNFESIEKEIISRTAVWNATYKIVKGPAVLTGLTDAMANSQLVAYLQMTTIVNLNDFHDAFVFFYANHGLVGLACYVYVLIYVFDISVFRVRSRRRLCILMTILFASSILFSMPESYVLFVNMSAIAFPTMMLFVICAPFLAEEAKKTAAQEVFENAGA